MHALLVQFFISNFLVFFDDDDDDDDDVDALPDDTEDVGADAESSGSSPSKRQISASLHSAGFYVGATRIR